MGRPIEDGGNDAVGGDGLRSVEPDEPGLNE